MLISRKLLERYVDIKDISTQDLADGLTNAGLEVEGISQLMQGTNLTVGKVLECTPHPDSDHLSVTKVDLGDTIEQIVCGAPNIRSEQTVIVARVGAILPELVIKPTKIRGIESNGMICSLKELGIQEKFINEEDKEGIVVLKTGNPGDDPRAVLGFDDEVIDVSQTPNRSDFLSIFSIAYEVSAIFNRPLTLPSTINTLQEEQPSKLKITSLSPNAPAFMGKVINQVTIKESPKWIKEVLIASNIKPINNVVDISNLVMLETGQPLHFYDSDFLSLQELSVRDDLELQVTALDEKEYTLQKGDLVIMNGDTPVGIAGIMGLGNSMIHEKTKGIVIEVASFDMVRIRKTASRLGLSTESSQRFSKPMDPLAPLLAMNRAVSLLIEYADAQAIEETVTYGVIKYDPIKVPVTLDKINHVLGTQLDYDTVMDVFQRLHLNPVYEGNQFVCTIPSYRRDLSIDVDLIEEVIRIVGYDILEETLPLLDLTEGKLTPRQSTIRMIEDVLIGYGGYETITYTLVEDSFVRGGESLENPIRLLSPMSDKRAYLRTQLIPSLLEVASYNASRKQDQGLYFEISNVYTENRTHEKLAILGMGTAYKNNWLNENVVLDFYALKGMFLGLMDKLGFASKRFEFVAEGFDDTLFHPFKTASILFDRTRIGVLGHIHPKVADAFDLKDTTVLEVDLESIFNKKKGSIKAQELSPYPSVTRDLAILCDKSLNVKELMSTIEKASSRMLLDANVFDVFTSEKLKDQKSVGIALTFGTDHTLSMDEIQTIMDRITQELIVKHAITIR